MSLNSYLRCLPTPHYIKITNLAIVTEYVITKTQLPIQPHIPLSLVGVYGAFFRSDSSGRVLFLVFRDCLHKHLKGV